jgi:hypothetical protein
MTTGITAPRANRDGHPCPPWCTADHDEPLIGGRPELGYVDTHRSDPMTDPARLVRVRAAQYPGKAAEVQLHKIGTGIVGLMPERARILADVLEETARLGASAVTQLADELRAAAAIAGESR